MGFLSFLLEYKFVIIFYLAIILLVYFNRKKFEVQAKIIYLYKTKFGLKFMDRFSRPLSEKFDRFGAALFSLGAFVTIICGLVLVANRLMMVFFEATLLSSETLFLILEIFSVSFLLLLIAIIFFKQLRNAGRLGVYVGFVGMALITIFVINGFVDLFLKPGAPAVISPVIPGVSIPGSPISIPFWYGIIALFIVVLIHEFSHGIICRVHNIKVKSSGVGMLAILPLAFVEPDEKSLRKSKPQVQNSMFAAGPFSNILTGILVILIMMFVLIPGVFSFTEPIEDGLMLFSHEGTPAYNAGIGTQGSRIVALDVLTKVPLADKYSNLQSQDSGVFISKMNGVKVNSVQEFLDEFHNVKIGEPVTFSNDEQSFSIIPIDKGGEPYIGVNIVNLRLKENANTFWFGLLLIILELFVWIYTFSFGLGLANLLPLGIADGGRMLHVKFEKWFGEKKALFLFSRVTAVFLAVILVLVIVPIIRAVV